MKKTTLKRVILHIIFWIVFASIYPMLYNIIAMNSFNPGPLNISINIFQFVGVIPLAMATYFISYYLVPEFLIKKRNYILFVFLYIATFFIISFIDIYVAKYTVIANNYPQSFDNYLANSFKFKSFTKTLLILHSQVFIIISLRFIIEYLRNYVEKEKLKAKMVETKLNNLKSQLHPHFLFNTLNNIYSLSLDTENEALSTSIAKISEILRFSLYECDTEVIPLEKEVNNIFNYIELEKLRYSNIRIAFNTPEDTNGVSIIPLILFTFVENAFKHGAGKTIKNKWISINLFLTNDDLFFNVKNSKKSSSKKSKTTNFHSYSNGIGISNSIKRLELFYGKNNYKLTINDEDTYFEIDLQLKLSNINKNPKDS